MVLVFGGTTEGKQAIEVLKTLNMPFIYSTKTDIQPELPPCGTYRFGALDANELQAFIVANGITSIVHASHPFAVVLHSTINKAVREKHIPVFRLQRQFPKRLNHHLVHYLDNYTQIEECITKDHLGKISLFLTGVQSIEKLKPVWQSNPTFFRILDRPSSIDLALDSNYAYNQLILGLPNKHKDDEIQLIKDLSIDVVFTKESGHSGSLSVKIEAAIECNIPIYILKKPELPKAFKCVENVNELTTILSSFNKSTTTM